MCVRTRCFHRRVQGHSICRALPWAVCGGARLSLVLPWSGVKAADKLSASCIQTIVTEKKPWTYEFMAHNDDE